MQSVLLVLVESCLSDNIKEFLIFEQELPNTTYEIVEFGTEGEIREVGAYDCVDITYEKLQQPDRHVCYRNSRKIAYMS